MTTREVVLDGGSPWGFRLHGGADVNQPLRISRVNPGSKAALRGIREGDLITSINNRSTKDISNAEAHALLRNSGDTLKLGLNEDCSGSPKRRQYKTVHQETHSETVKKSSITSYTLTSSKTVSQTDISNEQKTSNVNGNNAAVNGDSVDQAKNPIASQRSTLSSNCSSSSSTPSTYTEPSVMPDKRRKRTRNRRKAKINTNQSTHVEIIEEEDNSVEVEYRVESPKLGKETTKKTPVKSKSLDDDDLVKIQELSEVSESEEKADSKAIVSEAESDMEEPVLTLPLDTSSTEESTLMSPEEELTLRNFLESLNLVDSPEDSFKKVQEVSTMESVKTKRAAKRAALEQYFNPIIQNPRYLDVINEETSDVSDKEPSLTRHLKQGTPEPEVPKLPPKGRLKNKMQSRFQAPISNPTILVGAKIVEVPMIGQSTCSTTSAQPSDKAELVYLEDSSNSNSPDPKSDNEEDLGKKNEENSVAHEREAVEEQSRLRVSVKKNDEVVSISDQVEKKEEISEEKVKYDTLTPPPTPVDEFLLEKTGSKEKFLGKATLKDNVDDQKFPQLSAKEKEIKSKELLTNITKIPVDLPSKNEHIIKVETLDALPKETEIGTLIERENSNRKEISTSEELKHKFLQLFVEESTLNKEIKVETEKRFTSSNTLKSPSLFDEKKKKVAESEKADIPLHEEHIIKVEMEKTPPKEFEEKLYEESKLKNQKICQFDKIKKVEDTEFPKTLINFSPKSEHIIKVKIEDEEKFNQPEENKFHSRHLGQSSPMEEKLEEIKTDLAKTDFGPKNEYIIKVEMETSSTEDKNNNQRKINTSEELKRKFLQASAEETSSLNKEIKLESTKHFKKEKKGEEIKKMEPLPKGEHIIKVQMETTPQKQIEKSYQSSAAETESKFYQSSVKGKLKKVEEINQAVIKKAPINLPSKHEHIIKVEMEKTPPKEHEAKKNIDPTTKKSEDKFLQSSYTEEKAKVSEEIKTETVKHVRNLQNQKSDYSSREENKVEKVKPKIAPKPINIPPRKEFIIKVEMEKTPPKETRAKPHQQSTEESKTKAPEIVFSFGNNNNLTTFKDKCLQSSVEQRSSLKEEKSMKHIVKKEFLSDRADPLLIEEKEKKNLPFKNEHIIKVEVEKTPPKETKPKFHQPSVEENKYKESFINEKEMKQKPSNLKTSIEEKENLQSKNEFIIKVEMEKTLPKESEVKLHQLLNKESKTEKTRELFTESFLKKNNQKETSKETFLQSALEETAKLCKNIKLEEIKRTVKTNQEIFTKPEETTTKKHADLPCKNEFVIKVEMEKTPPKETTNERNDNQKEEKHNESERKIARVRVDAGNQKSQSTTEENITTKLHEEKTLYQTSKSNSSILSNLLENQKLSETIENNEETIKYNVATDRPILLKLIEQQKISDPSVEEVKQKMFHNSQEKSEIKSDINQNILVKMIEDLNNLPPERPILPLFYQEKESKNTMNQLEKSRKLLQEDIATSDPKPQKFERSPSNEVETINSKTIYTNVLSPSGPSPSPSLSSGSSTRTTSTAKYNPMSSSIGDMSSVAEVPLSLRELCLNFLASRPYGADVLQELAEVAESIENLTSNIVKDKCLGPLPSPTQQRTEASKLLDLHDINRPSYHDERGVDVEITSIKDESSMENDRLRAKDLNEWLRLARNKSSSLCNLMEESHYRKDTRRTSLPQDFYNHQMRLLQEKERQIQRELEHLEDEKRRLCEEVPRNFNLEDFHISRKGDFAEIRKPRPNSMPSTEVFRQQMYEEYMDQFAKREERKQHKVIKVTTVQKSGDAKMATGIEDEFMDKVKEKQKLGKLLREEENQEMEQGDLPKHLQEFVQFTTLTDDERGGGGVWSPGQKQQDSGRVQEQDREEVKDEPISPVWTPKSATSSPTVERKEFRPVKFESPVLSRKNYNRVEEPPSETTSSKEPPWKAPETSSDTGLVLSSTLQKRLPTSHSSPASGFNDFSTTRLPKAQNPTITLLQKAREGQLPKGAFYIEQDQKRPHNDKPPLVGVGPGEILYKIKNEYTSESDSEKPRKMVDLGPRKFEGIGPTTKDGMPLILRSEVKDANQSKWYKKMYDTIHKQRPHRDEFVTVRYRQKRGQYPYTSGYLSEPEPGAYDSDYTDYKYATLDRRRVNNKENDYMMSSTMPRDKPGDVIKHGHDPYKNQPGRIENYIPGHSSISEKEAKEWWDEVMDIFDGHLEQQKRAPQTKSFMNQALKESGYESDSTLVFRRRDETGQQLSPSEQKEAYKIIQKGGDIPLHGLRKPAPERPKEPEPPVPPPKGHHGVRTLQPESPRKYVENEVTIHYKTPVRQEIKEYLSEDELAYRQAEAMKKIYQEERRRKYLQVSKSLQELQDMNNRRHTDNFIPSQKSPIPLNRYDDFDDLTPPVKPRPRSPEPRLIARALYNFVGQTARELTFRKGDLIYVRRQVDKNWYEGELNAMVGLFPVNYVEIVPYDTAKSTPRKSHEGQARAKYNFVAQTHLELSLAKGELVVITRRVDDNWFEGKIGGRKGIFPVSYVEVLIDPSDPPLPPSSKPVAAPAAHSLLLNGSAGGKESMGSHSYTPSLSANQHTSSYHAKPVQVTGSGNYGSLSRNAGKSPVNQTLHIETQAEPIPYRALYKYLPQNDDELELLEGDTVYVLEKCDDGWYVGSSDRTGAFGTFPGNYVEKI